MDKDHDRIEIRECWTLDAALYGPSIRNIGEWAKIKTLVMIRRERRLPDKTEIHTRYYISSLTGKADRFLQVIRHIALNLLRNEKTAKVGIKAKRLKAGWDDAYLFKVLSA